MIYIQPDLFIRIEQLDGEDAPRPLPLSHGFSANRIYRILGIYSASDTSEAYLILSNDREEIWFISNRHVRVHTIMPGHTETWAPKEESVRRET